MKLYLNQAQRWAINHDTWYGQLLAANIAFTKLGREFERLIRNVIPWL